MLHRITAPINTLLAALALATSSTWAARPKDRDKDMPSRWQFAGESKGVRFYFKIAHECADEGARVQLKIENTLDNPLTVSFRLVDPDWRRTFTRELSARGTDTGIRFEPDEGTACHPYVDEVYLGSRDRQLTQSGPEDADGTGRADGTDGTAGVDDVDGADGEDELPPPPGGGADDSGEPGPDE